MRTSVAWMDGRIAATRDLTPTVREIAIRPEPGPAQAFPPGAHIDVAVEVGGQPETRSYSLIGLGGDGLYRIAVKHRPDSKGGARYMWSLREGARLRFTEPKTSFPIDYDRPAYLLVAGGIGVTPLVGMAQALRRRGAPVRMLYAAGDRAELAYAEELAATLGEGLDLHVSAEGRRIDFGAAFGSLEPRAMAALCGPLTMLEAARRAWGAAGRPAPDLRWETFGTSGLHAAQDFRVLLPRHGLDLVVPQDRSLLDALADAGVGVIYDCRKGECGLCALPILAVDGVVDHRDVFFSDHQKDENAKLCVCVSRAVGTLTLDTDFRPDTHWR